MGAELLHSIEVGLMKVPLVSLFPICIADEWFLELAASQQAVGVMAVTSMSTTL
jgi:hypothetical protein